MPSLGAINTIKALTQGYQPLYLYVFTFVDREVNPFIWRTATHNLAGSQRPNGITGFPHNNQTFEGRVLNSDVAASAALSDSGVDAPPTVTVELADPDRAVWGMERLYGFKGAELSVYVAFWNVGTGDYSSDYRQIFSGTCGPAQATATRVSVTAKSRLTLDRMMLPQIRVQRRCPWTFPDARGLDAPNATALHQQAADDPSHPTYRCGYSPLASGGNARGNLDPANPGEPFRTCNRTREHCIARLGDATPASGVAPLEKDEAGRVTARFGGIGWDPVARWKSRGYLDKAWIEGTNNSNEAKYSAFVPLIYGAAWMDGLVLNVVGDANLTRMEVLLGLGEVANVRRVIVNDVTVERLSATPSIQKEQLNASLYYQQVSFGTRDGAANGDTLYDRQGDVYGSMSVICITVPRMLSQSSAVPRVRVLVDGVRVLHYETDGSEQGYFYSTNPAWISLDWLLRGPWRRSDVDGVAWNGYAGHADGLISYKTIYGGTATHPRYQMSVALNTRVSLADLLRQARVGHGFALRLSPAGKLQARSESTLALQQPAAIAGSNYNVGLRSRHPDGTVTTGFVAYKFDASTVLRDGDDGPPLVEVIQPQSAQTPNVFATQFQDKENEYRLDSLNLLDGQDVIRTGQENPGTLPLVGVISFDQNRRVLARHMAKQYRGNVRSAATAGDTGGTARVRLTTNFRVLHLQEGDLVLVDHERLSLNDQILTAAGDPVNGFLARVESLKPTVNHQRVEVVLGFHKDAWYLDTFGQEDPPLYSSQGRDQLARPSFGWLPNAETPLTNDVLNPPLKKGFRLYSAFRAAEDGSPIPTLEITGFLPVNTFAPALRTPSLATQGSSAPTGGSIAPGKYFFYAVAEDADGKLTTPSDPDVPCEVVVAAGPSTATVTVPVRYWDPAGVRGHIFGGPKPHLVSHQTDFALSGGGPATVTMPLLQEAEWGMPDVEFDRLEFVVRQERIGGVWGLEVVEVTANTIKVSLFDDNQFAVNQFAPASGVPYRLTLMGLKDAVAPLPICNWNVVSNTGDVLTVTGPDCTTVPRGGGEVGLRVGDVVVMRARWTAGEDGGGWYVEDANLVNAGNTYGPAAFVEDATNATPVVVTTATPHGFLDGQRVRIADVAGNGAANGVRYVDRLTATTFALYSNASLTTPVAGTGAYAGGGSVRRQFEGLISNSLIGHEFRIIDGPARAGRARVKSNTPTRIYMESAPAAPPEGNSVAVVLYPGPAVAPHRTESITNAFPSTSTTVAVPVPNFAGETLFVEAFTMDGGNNRCLPADAPWREIYHFGQRAEGSLGLTAIHLTVDGPCAIGADQAPRFRPDVTVTARSVVAEVKLAPLGAALTVRILYDDVPWLDLSIPAGNTTIAADPLVVAALPAIPAGANVRLDVLAVGTTTTDPGEDLAVTVYA